MRAFVQGAGTCEIKSMRWEDTVLTGTARELMVPSSMLICMLPSAIWNVPQLRRIKCVELALFAFVFAFSEKEYCANTGLLKIVYTLIDVFPERCVISRDFFFWFCLFMSTVFEVLVFSVLHWNFQTGWKSFQKKSLKYCMSATKVSKMVSKQKVNKSQKFVDFQMFVFKKNNLFFCVMFSSTWQEGWPSLPSLCWLQAL